MDIRFKDKFDESQCDRIFTVGGKGSGTDVAVSVAIVEDDGRRIQVNVLSSAGYSCFQDARWVGNIAYIGFGQYVFVVDTSNSTIVNHCLDGYFGHMYDCGDFEKLPPKFSVLVTSASEALAFSRAGELLWVRPSLGIDGVILHAADEKQFSGEGEWDPPGGWRQFSVLADSGIAI